MVSLRGELRVDLERFFELGERAIDLPELWQAVKLSSRWMILK
jgi:hypothetical protein